MATGGEGRAGASAERAAGGEARPDLLGTPLGELPALLERVGVPPGLAPAVFRAAHQDASLGSARGLLPRHVARLEAGTRRPDVEIERALEDADGTIKLVFRLGGSGSLARVEGVLMPLGRRWSFCASTQVGCGMGCAFCATARLGLTRSLTAGELVAQVSLARRYAAQRGVAVDNLVLMGMGEPLQDYPATRDALRVLLDPRGQALAPSRVRVSTVGLPRGIRALGRDFGGKVGLALSLHAGTDATRRRLIPAASAHDLATLREVCGDYPLPGKRYLMIEYLLLPGVTDTPAELDGLARWTRGLRCMVNLLPWNPFPGAPFRSPTGAEIASAHAALMARGVPVKVRRPRGRDVGAACGQLALRARDEGLGALGGGG